MFDEEDIMDYIGYQLYGGGTDPYFSDYISVSDPTALNIDAMEFFDFLDKKEAARRKAEEAKRIIEEAKHKIVVVVHYDVGFGNTLYIRGDTSPLSWDCGKECKNFGPSLWAYEMDCPYSKSVEFKVLINDSTWETGYNHSVDVGNAIHIVPQF